ERDQPRGIWFERDDDFDAALRAHFLADHLRAASGACTAWLGDAEANLALILLLDQLPRNLFRGSPRAYSCDAAARAAARHCIERRWDRDLAPVRRWFVYLPFEHSETLADQSLCRALCAGLASDPASGAAIRAAARHHEIIARFGRFPHRNAVLGRASTPAETAFLREPNSSF
ncbi:MAG: DUF924 domain-containing protein, partial [Alphaproteobacteria bacterium]|nr:DUF924 domain-containing protein [Alphaproteobacteria bacterium]